MVCVSYIGDIKILKACGVKLIALRCAGFNNVDMHNMDRNIKVVRVPAYSPYAVAEHAVALLLGINRKIYKAYQRTKKYNFTLNGLSPENEKFEFINGDVKSFLQRTKEKYDIIILDPPTFSNSKKTQTDLDINRDWPVFVDLCTKLLNKDGVLYFSTNSKKLRFEENLLPQGYIVKDITESTIPEDFKNKKIHKCWQIKSENQ
ncbi:MAG: hypothetical protein II232_00590 [Spirochaetaceae bacterium]|nr:hypothetical protein [Spirochaetaceae bacterium]